MPDMALGDLDEDEDLFDLYHQSGNARDERQADPEDTSAGDGLTNSGLDLNDMEVHDLLILGRKMLLKRLLDAVNKGYATPQEMAILAKLLKDNGMVMGDPFEGGSKPGSNGGPQRAPLPSFPKPEYAD